MLAELDLLAGDPRRAATRARESLALYTELEDDRSRARCLVVLAAAAAGGGTFETAARLIGAAEQLRGDDAPDEFERPCSTRFVPRSRRARRERTSPSSLADGRGRCRRARDCRRCDARSRIAAVIQRR